MPSPASTSGASRPDPRVVRSEAAIRSALLEQLESGRRFDSLTVSEIAASARLTRKTFYARFGSLDEVVHRIVLDLFTDIAASLPDELLRIPLTDDSLAVHVFEACEMRQAILGTLVSQCPAGLFVGPVSAVVATVLDRVIQINAAPPMDEAARAYVIATLASMVHGVLSVWTRRRFFEPADRVASFIDTLLADGLQKVVLANRMLPSRG